MMLCKCSTGGRSRVVCRLCLNYTWSHSLDNASDDTIETTAISSSVISGAHDYSSSSFDVRHSFSGAVSYLIPGISKKQTLVGREQRLVD